MGEKAKGGHKGSASEPKEPTTVAEAGHPGGKEVQHQKHARDSKEGHDEAHDKPGPPKGTAFGIAAITQALEGVEFPATKHALLARAGHQHVEYRKGQPVNLRKVIEDLKDEQFPSMANVVEGLSAALKEEDLSAHRGSK